MVGERLSLTWNEHSETCKTVFNSLRKQNILTDVTLACDGQQFQAHQLILATCSEYFCTILSSIGQHTYPIIYLKGILAEDIQALLEYMYTGNISLPQDQVKDLLEAAEALKIKGLSSEKNNSPHKNDGQGLYDEEYGYERDSADHHQHNNAHYSKNARDNPLKRSADNSAPFECADNRKLLTSNEHAQVTKKCKLRGSCSPAQQEAVVSDHVNDVADSHVPPPYGQHFLNDTANKDVSYNSNTSHRSVPVKDEPTSNDNYSSDQNKAMDNFNSTQLAQVTNRLPDDDSLERKDGIIQTHDTNDNSDDLQKNTSNETIAALFNIENQELSSLNMNSLGESSTMPSNAANQSAFINELYLDAFNRSAGLPRTLQPQPGTIQDVHPLVDLPIQNEGATTTTSSSSSSLANDNKEKAQSFKYNNTQAASGSTDSDAENRPHVCPVCHKTFAKAAILKRHHLAHFRPYKCSICSRSFTRKEVLAEHLQQHNGADLRLPCPVCGITIKRKRNLQAHIKVKHTDYYAAKTSANQSLF